MPEAAVAPTPTTAPPTTQAPTAPEKSPTEFMGDFEADFCDMAEGKPPRSMERKRDDAGKFKLPDKAPKAPTKPVEKPVEKPADNAAEKPAEKPKEGDTPPVEEKKPSRMRELGQAYDDLKKKVHTEYEPTIQSLKAKIKEFESKQPEDTAPLLAKLTALEKRNAELEKHIEYVDFTQSKEFLNKYAQPYRDAWDHAVADFRQLKVREQAGEDETTGEPIFKTRPASEADLLQLANMDLADMDETAQKLFGASAPRAISHIETLKKLSAAKSQAEDEARTRASEWKTQRATEAQTRTQKLAQTWTEINKSLQERFPKAFAPEENDAEDKEAHTRGFAMADLMFVGEQGLTPEQIEALPTSFRDTLKAGKPLSEGQKVQLHALARLKIANHDRKVAALKKAHARIKELEKAVEDYEKSEPAADKAGEAAQPSGKDFFAKVDEDLAKMDR
jgi:hypothetical protein